MGDGIKESDLFGGLRGKRVIVFGASGLVGGGLIDLLMRPDGADCEVCAAARNVERAKVRFAEYAGRKNFRIVKTDVENAAEFPSGRFDCIVNAAGGATPGVFAADPAGVMRANFVGMNNVLQWGMAMRPQPKVVYVSTGEVYGQTAGGLVKETDGGYIDPTDPRSCYPEAKRAAETLCACYTRQYGMDISIVRLCHVYGAGFTESDDRVYAQFIRNVLRGEDIVMKSRGDKYRSWLYLTDCAEALLTVMLRGRSGEAYNAADENSCVTIRELAETIAAIAGRKVVMDLSAAETSADSPIKRAVFSSEKLRSLGWRPRYSLEAGLRETIETKQRNSL